MIESAEEFARLRLSSTKEEYDRAAHEEAPVEVWIDVIENYPELRQWVAHNKTIPLEILECLVKNHPEVNSFVADKRKLSPELFDILSRDENYLVRERIAINAKTPIHILERLSKDFAEDVAQAARYNLKNKK
jgi:chromatin segregation and condensation protein Rec8/ScpA/Scc1 (kleisin family)